MQPVPAATWGHCSHGRFLSSGTPMTVQHFVHEPQDFPGTMDGIDAGFQSAPGYADPIGADAPARPALLCSASPIRIIFQSFSAVRQANGVLTSPSSNHVVNIAHVRSVAQLKPREDLRNQRVIMAAQSFRRPKSFQPVSAGTMAFSVTNQVRPFSIKMTLRAGAFTLARRCRNSMTLGARQASG